MIAVAFYRAPGRLYDRAIRWWTASPYSHCEMVLQRDGRMGECWSSSPRDGGVRQKTIELDPARWDLVPVPWVRRDALERTARRIGRAGYDWTGIFFSQVLASGINARQRWFCSELCAFACGLNHPQSFSPGSLHDLLIDINRIAATARAEVAGDTIPRPDGDG